VRLGGVFAELEAQGKFVPDAPGDPDAQEPEVAAVQDFA
jgi:hypothetical protein